jgi:hypothetical protein
MNRYCNRKERIIHVIILQHPIHLSNPASPYEDRKASDITNGRAAMLCAYFGILYPTPHHQYLKQRPTFSTRAPLSPGK